MKARLAALHPKLQEACYGEFGGDDAINDQLWILDEFIAKPPPKPRHGFKSRREEFRAEMSASPGLWRSSKMTAAVRCVKERLATSNGKMLVFSQFLSALDMLQIGLDENAIPVLRFDGTVSKKDRDTTLERFSDLGDGAPKVMLITVNCAAEGLTLTEADFVLHLNPCWNPYQELQCIGRTVRSGQTNPVSVVRLILDQSIELHIVEKQRIKLDKGDDLMEPRVVVRDCLVKTYLDWSEDEFRRAVSLRDRVTTCQRLTFRSRRSKASRWIIMLQVLPRMRLADER